jgi:succinate-semialdehyde dehydrogenase/glutarate-semialdehyde dehydrogenase
MAALKVGNGLDPSVDVGPLVNADTRDKVAEPSSPTRSPRARSSCCGGNGARRPGFFYPPTVLSNVPETADCVHDEIFGPVAAIQTFTDQEDAIRRANDTEYGLVAYVFTGDMKRGLQVCERLDYGMVGLNRGLVSDPGRPFGGTKQSGLGREGGHEGMLEFMETQYISAVDHAAYGPVEHEPLSRGAGIAAANLGAANRVIPQVTHHDRADMRAVEKPFARSLSAGGRRTGA